jgi:hypothetical protein
MERSVQAAERWGKWNWIAALGRIPSNYNNYNNSNSNNNNNNDYNSTSFDSIYNVGNNINIAAKFAGHDSTSKYGI